MDNDNDKMKGSSGRPWSRRAIVLLAVGIALLCSLPTSGAKAEHRFLSRENQRFLLDQSDRRLLFFGDFFSWLFGLFGFGSSDSSDIGIESSDDEDLSLLPTVDFPDPIKFFFEENTSDEDLGVQCNVGTDPCEKLFITGTDGVKMLGVLTGGTLFTHGMSDIFFESAEPNYEEVSRSDILARFPEGEYVFEAKTLNGTRALGTVTLSHTIPTGPVITSPVPDGETEDGDPLATVPPGNLTITWEEVRNTPINSYEVIITNDDEPDFVYDLRFGPEVFEVVVPGAWLAPGILYELEILARATNGNQAITLFFFELEEEDEE